MSEICGEVSIEDYTQNNENVDKELNVELITPIKDDNENADKKINVELIAPNDEPKKKKLHKKQTVVGEKTPRVLNYYSIDISDISSAVYAFNKFIDLRPEFFKTTINKKMVYINDNIFYIYNDKVYFKDTIHKVNGYITTSNNNGYKMTVHIRLLVKQNKQEESSSELQSTEQVASCYIKQVEKYVSNIIKNGDYVELHYNKILCDTIIKYCFYSQPVINWQDDVKVLHNEFFSPTKNYLLSIMNNKINNNKIGNITSSWNNLILHGPPGSGKSSFVYRIAMTLKMSILSIDLSLYLNKKKELYALFHNQEFTLPNNTDKQPSMTNVIIVLEEFDNSIEKLLDIENIFKYKNVLTRNYLDLKNKEIKTKTEKFQETPKENFDEKPVSKVVNKSLTYEEQVENDMLADGFDIKNNRIMENARNNILNMRNRDNEMNSINMELNNIIKDMNNDNTSNILRLSDLLELFQSPVHIKQRLIIATTNYFEKIQNTLPQLFRSGRLSDIKFDYLDWASLNDLTQYYFGKSISLEEFVISIPTSQVIELAIKYTLSNKAFEDFEKELHDLCKTK